MDQARIDDWVAVAVALGMGTGAAPLGDPGTLVGARSGLRNLSGIVVEAIDGAGGRWDRSVTAVLSARWSRPDPTVEDPSGGFDHQERYRHMRTAWHLVEGAPGRVPRGERAVVARALARAWGCVHHLRADPGHVLVGGTDPFAGLPGPADVAEADVTTVTIAFPRRLRPGSRIRVAVEGHLPVERVEASEAPVAARLANDRGDVVVVRRVGTLLYRPVLAPGGWEPVRMGRFVEACGTGEPWLDAPHLPQGAGRGRCPMPLDDLASPVTGGARHAEHDASAVARCRDRAGRLLIVDGVVHRRCDAPTIGLARHVGRTLPRGGLRLGWRLGNLTQFDDMGTYAPEAATLSWAGPGASCDLPGFWPPVPLARLDAALGWVASLGKAAREAVLVDLYRHATHPPTFEVVDPALLPDGVDEMLRAAAAWQPLVRDDGRPTAADDGVAAVSAALRAILEGDGRPAEREMRGLVAAARRAGSAGSRHHLERSTRVLLGETLALVRDVIAEPGPDADDDMLAGFSP